MFILYILRAYFYNIHHLFVG